MDNYIKKFNDYINLCHKNKSVSKNDYYNMTNKIYDEYSDIINEYISSINKIQNTIGYSAIPNINIRIHNARVNALKLLDENNINFYNFNYDVNPDYLFTLAIESYLFNKYCEAIKYIEDYLSVNIDLEKKYKKRLSVFKLKIAKLSIINDLKNNQQIINNYINVCDSLDKITDKSEILNIAISYLNSISNNIDDEYRNYIIATHTNVYASILHKLKCDSEIKKLLEESYKLTYQKVLKK